MQRQDVRREDRELVLTDVVNFSPYAEQSADEQAASIFNDFNRGVETSCFSESLIRGQWINPGEFLLGHRNKRAELARFNPKYNTARVLFSKSPIVTTEVLGAHKQTDLFYGAYGSYVLNVPVGHVAKAWSGTQPKMYGPGPHVIHDATFRFDKTNGLVDLTNTPYIRHETIHIVRVPAGKMAAVWLGQTPMLLEARDTPYVFNSPYFSINKQGDDYFLDATSRCIIHGSIKRLMPHTCEVAITYNNGNLEVVEPRSDNKPTIINSAPHEVSRNFLNTGIQTLVFPSEETKKQRKRDNPAASTDEVAYEIFTTKDSLKVGVKLLVAYRIAHPQQALSRLTSQQGILDHIENLATVDMGKAIQQSSSQEFLCFYQNRPVGQGVTFVADSQGAPVMHIQDMVKQQLSDDLQEYGIELVRLNIETPKIIDPNLATKMSEQAQKTAETSQKQATLQQEYEIAQRRAQQEANVNNIKLQQANEALLTQAEAKLKAAELDARALLVKAEANKQAAVKEGEQYQMNPALLELAKLRLQMEALSKAQLVPPQMATLMTSGMAGMPMTFFSGSPQQMPVSAARAVQHQPDAAEARHKL